MDVGDESDAAAQNGGDVPLQLPSHSAAEYSKAELVDDLDALLAVNRDADLRQNDTNLNCKSERSPSRDKCDNCGVSDTASAAQSERTSPKCNGVTQSVPNGASRSPSPEVLRPSRSKPGKKFRSASKIVVCVYRPSSSDLQALTSGRNHIEIVNHPPFVPIRLLRLSEIHPDVVLRFRETQKSQNSSGAASSGSEPRRSQSRTSEESDRPKRGKVRRDDSPKRSESRQSSSSRDADPPPRRQQRDSQRQSLLKRRRVYDVQPAVSFQELMLKADEKKKRSDGAAQSPSTSTAPPASTAISKISFKKIGTFKASPMPPTAASTSNDRPFVPAPLPAARSSGVAFGGSRGFTRGFEISVDRSRRPQPRSRDAGPVRPNRPSQPRAAPPPQARGQTAAAMFGSRDRSPSPDTKAVLAARRGFQGVPQAAPGSGPQWANHIADMPRAAARGELHVSPSPRGASAAPIACSPSPSSSRGNSAHGGGYAPSDPSSRRNSKPMPEKPKSKPSLPCASGISEAVEGLSDSDDDELQSSTPRQPPAAHMQPVAHMQLVARTAPAGMQPFFPNQNFGAAPGYQTFGCVPPFPPLPTLPPPTGFPAAVESMADPLRSSFSAYCSVTNLPYGSTKMRDLNSEQTARLLLAGVHLSNALAAVHALKTILTNLLQDARSILRRDATARNRAETALPLLDKLAEMISSKPDQFRAHLLNPVVEFIVDCYRGSGLMIV